MGIEPDGVTFVHLFHACAATKNIENGRQMHAKLIKSRIVMVLQIHTSLISMYVKCGSLEEATLVFKSTSHRDVITYEATIAGLAHQGNKQAIDLFYEMQN